MAQIDGIGAGEEMPVLDQHVARDRQLHAGGGREQGAIVADAQVGPAGALALEELFDEVEFGKHLRIVIAPFN